MNTTSHGRTSTIIAGAAAIALVSCSESAPSGPAVALPRGAAAVTLSAADFTTDITNPYWPMTPGRRWTYTERDADGTEATAVIVVTDHTKVVASGITTRVVRDTLTRDGQIIEDTFDYYAQDRAGNLWYFGEQTGEYDGGQVVTTAGSFESGVGGALPGIAVPADPTVGMAYRQEYLKGEAEDDGQVLSLDEMAEVPAGSYQHVLMTKDTTPLEPSALEYKLYAKGVGPVLVLQPSGGSTRTELISVDTAPAGAGTRPLGT